jgi:hypothetical protein
MGSKDSTVTQQTQPNPIAMANYQAVMGRANNVASTPYQPYTGQLVAGLSPTQQSGIQNLNNAQGAANPYLQTAQGLIGQGTQQITPQGFSSGALQQYMNPYQQQVIDSTMANIGETNAQQAQQLKGNAVASGAFGGDRAGVAQAELARQQGLASNQTLAGLNSQNYSQALGEFNTQQQMGLSASQANAQNALQGASLSGGLGQLASSTAIQGAMAQLYGGGLDQQTQQNILNSAYQQWQNQQSYPFQTTGWLANIAEGTGSQMGGSSSSTQPGPSAASQIGGAALGTVGMLGATGAFGSAGWLTGLLGLSDIHAKEDVQEVGKTFDGQPIVKFRYKGDPTPRMGLIAQEVEKTHPEAVHPIPGLGGLKGVDYDLATADSARKGKFAVGGVPAPYGQDAPGIVPDPAMQVTRGLGPPPPPKPETPEDPMQQVFNAIPTLKGIRNDMGAGNAAPQKVVSPIQNMDLNQAARGGAIHMAMGGVPYTDAPPVAGLGALTPAMPGNDNSDQGGGSSGLGGAFFRPIGQFAANGMPDPNGYRQWKDATGGTMSFDNWQRGQGVLSGLGATPTVADVVQRAPWMGGDQAMQLLQTGHIAPAANSNSDMVSRVANAVPALKQIRDRARGGAVQGFADGGSPDDGFVIPPAAVAGLGSLVGAPMPDMTPAPVAGLGALDLSSPAVRGRVAPLAGDTIAPPANAQRIDSSRDMVAPPRDPAYRVNPADTVAPDGSNPVSLVDVARQKEQQYNLPPGTLMGTVNLESHWNPNARNPNSSAAGLLQFTDSTARQYGLTNPFDPYASLDAGARLAADNRTTLEKALGREPTAAELYLAHQQGAGGAIKLLSNPNALASDLVGPDAVRLNGGDPGSTTAGQFANLWTGKFSTDPDQYSAGAQDGQTAGLADLPVAGGHETQLQGQAGLGAPQSDDAKQNAWLALAAAGFGMMGGKSKFAGQNIGEGALAGLQTYLGLQQKNRQYNVQQQELGLRGRSVDLDAQRLQQQAQQFAQQQGLRQQEVNLQGKNIESEANLRNVQAGAQRYQQTITPAGIMIRDTQNPDQPPRLVPFSQLQTGSTGAAAPSAPTGAATPTGQSAGATGAPGQPVAAPSTAGAAPQPEPIVPAALTSVTEPPQNIPINSMLFSPQGQQVAVDLTKKTMEKAKDDYDSAQGVKLQLDQMQHALQALPASGLLSQGPGVNARTAFAKSANQVLQTIGLQPYFDPNAIGSVEELNKLTTRLGFDLARSLGSREAGFIVNQAVAAVPGAENTKAGAQRIMASLDAVAQRQADYYGFIQKWAQRTGGDVTGADQYFNQVNPPQKYVDRALISVAPQTDIAAVQKDPRLATRFDQKYGQGLSRYVLGQ